MSTPFPDDEDYDIKPGDSDDDQPIVIDDELPAHVIRQRAARRRFMEGVDSGTNREYL